MSPCLSPCCCSGDRVSTALDRFKRGRVPAVQSGCKSEAGEPLLGWAASA